MTDQPRRMPSSGDDRDTTSELPTGRSVQLGKDATSTDGRSAEASGNTTDPYGRRTSDEAYQRPAAPYGAGGPVGREPVPTYVPQTQKKYSAVLPAVAASVVTALIALIPGLLYRNDTRPPTNRYLWDAWYHASFYDLWHYQFRRSPEPEHWPFVVAVVSLAAVTFVLVLLALLAHSRHGGRGLLFFAVWGIVALAGTAASLASTVASIGLELVGRAGAEEALLRSIDFGAGFGVRFGWLPALAAVALRIGRVRRY